MNIVGTPCSAVQRSSWIALKDGERVEARARDTRSWRRAATQPRFAMTMPKQW